MKHHLAKIAYVDENLTHVQTSTWFNDAFFEWEDTIDEPYLVVAARFTFFSNWKLSKVLGGTVYMIKEALEGSRIR